MFEQMLIAFFCFLIGTCFGLFLAALMRANDLVRIETCHKCIGAGGYRAGPNDWRNCDMCDGEGEVRI